MHLMDAGHLWLKSLCLGSQCRIGGIAGSTRNMSANDARHEQNDAFAYRGREGENVSRRMIHVGVHPPIKVILVRPYLQCKLLIHVELHNGIEKIEENTFFYCTSLCKFLIPPVSRQSRIGHSVVAQE